MNPASVLPLVVLQEGSMDALAIEDWDNLIWPVTLLLADVTDRADYHTRLQQEYLASWLCRYACFHALLRLPWNTTAVLAYGAECALQR